MKPEFSGIERRLEKLRTCLKKLEPFKTKEKEEILRDSYLQDIIERNLEVTAQAAKHCRFLKFQKSIDNRLPKNNGGILTRATMPHQHSPHHVSFG